MDDMNAFERQVANEVVGSVRQPGSVDVATIVRNAATQSPKWRFQSMFSATKFVVAGVIVALFGGFLLSGVLTTQQQESVPGAASGGPGTFGAAGVLAEGRESHTATLLPDGRVLIIGGDARVGAYGLASAEAWDPTTASFASAGAAVTGRRGHSATALLDGRVLVVGGDDGAGGTTADVWEPATESVEPAGTLAEPRPEGHTATLLADGRVLVVGGDGLSGSAEVWDPTTESFGPAGSLAQAREGHTATLLPDGRVLVVGGTVESGTGYAEIWDPVTDTFALAGSLVSQGSSSSSRANGARYYHTATLLTDGRVLVIGGSCWGCGHDFDTAEIWDPQTMSFEPAGTLAQVRGGHTATLLTDGRVLVVGGGTEYGLASEEVWDPATETFSAAGSLTEARGGHTATLLLDGRVLVVGGTGHDDDLDDSGVRVSAEVWEPSDG
jgi:hypothetical protein